MPDQNMTAILLLSCQDRIGLVSKISQFIFERGGNILDLNQHVGPEDKIFSIRVSWDMRDFTISPSGIKEAFKPLAKEFDATWDIKFAEEKIRLAIFVSKYDHCLQELLWRHSQNEFTAEIPLIVSNHPDLKSLADQYGIPFHVFPITKENKLEQEKKELKLLAENKVETVVMARYMQVLSPQFLAAYPSQIINIHHSFLPAFIGRNPYKQAYQRGVKIIGATGHYATEELDDGPIIEQEITRISHRDSINDLVRKGRDLERLVLARALHYHCEHRILVNGNKTIIFD
ncbi:MAG: formyltetrahydrofolate deformylase [Candidatus Binatia bacterium]